MHLRNYEDSYYLAFSNANVKGADAKRDSVLIDFVRTSVAVVNASWFSDSPRANNPPVSV